MQIIIFFGDMIKTHNMMKFDNPWMMLAIMKEHVQKIKKKDNPEISNIIRNQDNLYLTEPSFGWFSIVEKKKFVIAIKDLVSRNNFKIGAYCIYINNESVDKLISLLKTCSGRNRLSDYFNEKCDIPEIDKIVVKILKLKVFFGNLWQKYTIIYLN